DQMGVNEKGSPNVGRPPLRSEGGTWFRDEQRGILRTLADALIPRTEEMPSATDVGASDKWIDRVLAARPEIHSQLADIFLTSEPADGSAALAQLERDDPEGLATLEFAVMAAYYMAPRVRRLIG